MNRFIRFLTRMETGFFLLIVASALLLTGGIIADVHDTSLRALNFLTFQKWFPKHSMRPLLYVWILLLFGIFFLLAVNTFLCTVSYVRNMSRKGLSARRWGIVLFHCCFLMFLSGHFLYGFTGICEKVMVEEDIPCTIPALGLSLVPFAVEKGVLSVYGQEVPAAVKAGITVSDERGGETTIHPATLRPKRALGYTVHISMKDKALSHSQVGIIVRKQYGLDLLIGGGITMLMAMALFLPSVFRSRGR